MRFALALTAALTLVGCGSVSITAPDTAFRIIAHGSGFFSGVVHATINDAGTWDAFVAQGELRAPSFRPEDPIPAINFGAETAVVISLGQRPTTGYRIEVDRVEQTAIGIAVNAREIVPCVGATVLTYPLTVIAVPKFSGSISVNWSRVPCQP